MPDGFPLGRTDADWLRLGATGWHDSRSVINMLFLCAEYRTALQLHIGNWTHSNRAYAQQAPSGPGCILQLAWRFKLDVNGIESIGGRAEVVSTNDRRCQSHNRVVGATL